MDEILSNKTAEAEARGRKLAEEAAQQQLSLLETALASHKADAQHLKEEELKWLQERQRLQQAAEDAELTLQRRLAEERGTIRDEARRRFEEEQRLKDLTKDQTILDLKNALDAMKKRVEQGSMERQGEVLEQSLEDQIRRGFLRDVVRPVPKGVRGADLLHGVCNESGEECGNILWEIKNTKAWSKDWIPKLKEDAIAVGAPLCLLVSVVLPPDIDRFGQLDGVWICEPASAMALAGALRQQLLALDLLHRANIGRTGKMDRLYTYLSGTEFRQKVQSVVEGFVAMQQQLAKERRAMESQWKAREKLLDRVLINTAGFYGDLQGIIGQNVIGEIRELTLGDTETKPRQLGAAADTPE